MHAKLLQNKLIFLVIFSRQYKPPNVMRLKYNAQILEGHALALFFGDPCFVLVQSGTSN